MNDIDPRTMKPYDYSGAHAGFGVSEQDMQRAKAKADLQSKSAIEAMPRSDMEHAQDYMDAQIGQLYERISMLEKRLLPVLKPYPTGESANEALPADVAPLVIFFAHRSYRIQEMNGRLDALTRNLAI